MVCGPYSPHARGVGDLHSRLGAPDGSGSEPSANSRNTSSPADRPLGLRLRAIRVARHYRLAERRLKPR
jgi:hypothetical protein